MVAVAAQPFGEADRELALAAEARDRLAQLLDAREAGVVVADLDIEADDARILGGLPQELHGLRQVALVAPQAAAQQAARRVFGRQLAQVEREHHGGGQLPGRERPGDDEDDDACDRQQRHRADGGQQADDEPPHGRFAPL